jgi:nucleotide-binding universal stress UspA family protein
MNTNRLFRFAPADALPAARLTVVPRASNAPGTMQQQLPIYQAAGGRIRNIAVPLDGSAFAEHAIPLALGIAEQCGAIVQLVHVIVAVDLLDPFDALRFPDAALRTLKRRKHKYLAEVVDQISAQSHVFIAPHVIDGRAVPQTLDGLDGLNADLVVMATHARGPIGRFWWGSVAHSLLQRISVPLILVRGSSAPINYVPKVIDQVLLPLDGTKETERVLNPLLNFGLFHNARHTLMRVIRLEPKFVAKDYALRTEWVPSRRRWIAAMQHLSPLARRLRDHNRRVHTRVISSDEPVGQVVLRCTDQSDADLVALTYRRRGALGRLLRPSVSEFLFRAASCPLMFVPTEQTP